MPRTTKKTIDKTPLMNVQLQQIKLPTFEERILTGKEYVRYGDDNLFPQFLTSLCNRSAIHNAIVSSKLDYAYANGLELKDTTNPVTKLFMTRVNPTESLNDVYKKVLYDYILTGAFALNVIWAQNGEVISQIYHVDIANIRSGQKNERGEVTEYFYSDNWQKCTTNDKCKRIAAFDPSNRVGSQLLYVKDWRPGCTYYALPSYVGALNSIATDAEITNFHLSHLVNGMNPSKLITFSNGYPTADEEMKIKRQIENLYTGSDAAGRYMLAFVDDPAKVPQVETLGGDNLDQQFIQLEASVLQQILSGHKVTSPLLVGLRDGNNGLGSNTNEIQAAFQLFHSTVIRPLQSTVIDGLNMLLSFTNKYTGGKLCPTSNKPVEFTWSENVLTQIMTKDEMRARIGLPPIKENDEDTIISDSTMTSNEPESAN